MRVIDVYEAIDLFAPFHTAESWDNVGILAGDPGARVTKAIVALDCTETVIAEALKEGAQLIVTHHPIIFSPLKSVTPKDIAYDVIRNGLSVISAHTNLDIAPGGVNDYLAEVLELTQLEPLSTSHEELYNKIVVFVPVEDAEPIADAMAANGAGQLGRYDCCTFTSSGTGTFRPLFGADPTIGEIGSVQHVAECRVEAICHPKDTPQVIHAMLKVHPYETPAYDIVKTQSVSDTRSLGRVGMLDYATTTPKLASLLRQRLWAPGIQYFDAGKEIKKIAVCGGSGFSLFPQVLASGADAFVTADVKHDNWLAAQRAGISLIDAGHYNTERVVLHPLCNALADMFPDETFFVSKTEKDFTKFVITDR